MNEREELSQLESRLGQLKRIDLALAAIIASVVGIAAATTGLPALVKWPMSLVFAALISAHLVVAINGMKLSFRKDVLEDKHGYDDDDYDD